MNTMCFSVQQQVPIDALIQSQIDNGSWSNDIVIEFVKSAFRYDEDYHSALQLADDLQHLVVWMRRELAKERAV